MPLRGGKFRGFPFEDAEGSDAWSELAARHPDIAARLRQRPASATWARKRRPSSQDATDDFGENFGNFGDRFGFDDFPPEFREHLPSHWNRGFGSREEAPPQPPPAASPPPQPPQPQQHTAATQTEAHPDATGQGLAQHGLRNTVDLGQRSPADPSVVDAEERAHRSASAPPDCPPPPPAPAPPRDMSAPRPEPPHADSGNVRVIPIFVEGRDDIDPADRGKPRAAPEPKPAFDRDQYFADDAGASYHHPPNFPRAFGTPNPKGFRQPSQPYQQKVFPQGAYARGASPQRSQSPKRPTAPPAQEERFTKVPVQHQHAAPPRAATPHQPPPPPPEREQSPPYVPPKPCITDPITQILSIQTDVLNLMTEVENFAGTKKDKRYLFLDEMLTRNLIKLDNIETDGKENIRLARKEAIRCIQKCIAVLEAKAEKNGCPPQPADVDMKDTQSTEAPAVENGDVEKVEQSDQTETKPMTESQPQEDKPAQEPDAAPPATDLQDKPKDEPVEHNKEDKPSPKKKVVKKRDKSKDKAPSDSVTDSNKAKENVEVMQIDNKVDKTEPVMEVDGAASQ